MNYIDGRKCLDEILAAVTPEDEERFLLSVEYLKNYKGVVIGPIHEDWYGNCVDVFLTKNKFPGKDENYIYTWNSFDEAKKKIEGKENTSQRVFHVKEGLKIAFPCRRRRRQDRHWGCTSHASGAWILCRPCQTGT